MKRTPFCLMIVLCIGICAAAQTRDIPHRPRILIKFKAGSRLLAGARSAAPAVYGQSASLSETPLAAFASDLAGSGIVSIKAAKPDAGLEPLASGMERLFVAELNPVFDVAAAIRLLAAHPDIEYAERDYIAHGTGTQASAAPEAVENTSRNALVVPNDPSFTGQWSLRNTGQSFDLGGGKIIKGTPGADINATAAWDITQGSGNVTMAILDTGIAMTADEFAGRLVPGKNFVIPSTDPVDDQGHGTGVASVAAATGNNGKSMAGVDWSCKIMPVKVIDKNNIAEYSNIILGLNFAADSGAKVINLSLAGSSDSQALRDAVTYANSKGAIVVASMGNDGTEEPKYPAGFSNVIAVGATNSNDQRVAPLSCSGAGGSNYGNHIDFVAPGDMLYGLNYQDLTQILLWCGTSVAAPMVSGTITLMLAANPNLSNDQVYAMLKAGARDQVGSSSEDIQGWDKYYGWGRIDAYRSLLAAKGTKLFSQVAIGGGYRTVFTFLNTGSAPASGNLNLIDKDGQALDAILAAGSALPSSAPSNDRVLASSIAITVPPGGVKFITADVSNPNDSTKTGWARMETLGGLVGGVGTFQLTSAGKLQTIAGVLASDTVDSATIPVDNDDSQKRFTGYALANPGSDGITINIVPVDQNGNTVSPNPLKPITLEKNQQKAGFLHVDAPALVKFKGSLVLTGQGGKRFSVVALILNNDLYTAIPVIPAKAPNIN